MKKLLLILSIIIGNASLSAADMNLNDSFFVGKGITVLKKAYCDVVNTVVNKNVDLMEIKADVAVPCGHTHFDNKKGRIVNALDEYLTDVLITNGNGGDVFSGGHVAVGAGNHPYHGTNIVNPAADTRDDLKTALLDSISNMTVTGEIAHDQACEANAVVSGTSPFVHYYTKIDAIQHAFLDRLEKIVSTYAGDDLNNALTVAHGTNDMKCNGQDTAVKNRHIDTFLPAPANSTGKAWLDALQAVVINVGD